MTTLLDAGPLVAILNAEDAHHEWAVDHARRLEAPLLTCEAVLSEAHFLLQDTPGGRSRLIEIAESDRLRVPFSYTAHAGRVHDLVRTYSDLPASFADACLVRMAEVHDDARVFTVDSDVRVYSTGMSARRACRNPGFNRDIHGSFSPNEVRINCFYLRTYSYHRGLPVLS